MWLKTCKSLDSVQSNHCLLGPPCRAVGRGEGLWLLGNWIKAPCVPRKKPSPNEGVSLGREEFRSDQVALICPGKMPKDFPTGKVSRRRIRQKVRFQRFKVWDIVLESHLYVQQPDIARQEHLCVWFTHRTAFSLLSPLGSPRCCSSVRLCETESQLFSDPGKKGNPFLGRPFLVGQPPKTEGTRVPLNS